jgi:hypothetical protein
MSLYNCNVSVSLKGPKRASYFVCDEKTLLRVVEEFTVKKTENILHRMKENLWTENRDTSKQIRTSQLMTAD